jgi:hypothetical protein
MKSRPILFSAPMVLALLAGTKTQTRRIVKLQDPADYVEGGAMWTHAQQMDRCPYGHPGDRLWVRETWGYTRQCDDMGDGDVIAYAAGGEHVYEDVDGRRRLRLTKSGAVMRPNHFCYPPKPWRPSIFMPQWASRLTLEITGIRVERLQEISHGDACREGAPGSDQTHADGEVSNSRIVSLALDEVGIKEGDDALIEWYADLWESINGAGSWDVNPWVWVVEFKRVQQ